MLSNEWRGIDALTQAVVVATAEAVLKSLAAAETAAGRDGNMAHGLAHRVGTR